MQISLRKSGWHWIFGFASAGFFVGSCIGSAGAALLVACGGAIAGWAVAKGAVIAAIRGALLGALFAAVVGPGADFILNGVPIREKLHASTTIGVLVGGLLGTRNFRQRKTVADLLEERPKQTQSD